MRLASFSGTAQMTHNAHLLTIKCTLSCNRCCTAVLARLQDLVHMRELLQYTARNAYATTLLLFPEGTDLSASNVEKSRKFAESKGITPTHYVLQVS
jgi:hypothetical protein